MAKTLTTQKSVLKLFGIKILEFNSDYLWREFAGEIEDIRDDIILHERISESLENKNKKNN